MDEAATCGQSPDLPRPIVFVAPDLQEPDGPRSSSDDSYVLRMNYAAAIFHLGGLPLVLTHEADTDALELLLALADGLVVTGSEPGMLASPRRKHFETRLIEAALKRELPLLGICHGMQLIGSLLGGRIEWIDPAQERGFSSHLPARIPEQQAHTITLAPHSILNPTPTPAQAMVNSLHRHHLIGPGRFQTIAQATDGVIEAIAGNTKGFVLGLQWHPEYLLGLIDRRALQLFIEHCIGHARRRIADQSAGSQQ